MLAVVDAQALEPLLPHVAGGLLRERPQVALHAEVVEPRHGGRPVQGAAHAHRLRRLVEALRVALPAGAGTREADRRPPPSRPRRAARRAASCELVAHAQQRDRLQPAHRAGRAGEGAEHGGAHAGQRARRGRPPPGRPRTPRRRAARPGRCRAGGRARRARPRAPRRRRSASRKSRSALRPATWSISRPFRITCAAVAAIAPSTSSSAGAAAWRPALSRTPTSSPPAWIGAATPGGGVGDAGQQLAVAGLGQHPHPAGERIEQRGVGHPFGPAPGAGDRADAVAAARVAGREQHRVGAEQRAGRVRQPVQRAAPGRGRAEVVDRRGQGADRVELPPSLGVQLRRLDRGRDQGGDRRHQREVVLGELVRRLGVQGDHSDEPVGRRDQRVGEGRLEPLVVQLGDQQVARIVAGVVARRWRARG